MADEIVKILKVETGDSQQTVKGLREEIKDLRDAILNLDEGTEDYSKAVNKLQKDQRKLDQVMSLTKKNATALEGSYDALVQKMSLLKSEWKKTNDQAKRNELGKQIAAVNEQLKEMDESIGNYQRNVGNYTESIIDAFEQMNHSVDEWKNKAADAWEKGDIEEYTKAIEEAGRAQAKVEKIEQDLEANTPTLEKGFESLTGTAAGLAGGFEAVQAIMALTGVETGSFEKVMQKFQLTIALVQGIQGLSGLAKSLKGLKVAIKAVNSTVKAAMASNPVGWILLIVGAVVSLTTALANFNKEGKKNKSRVEEMKEEQEALGFYMKENEKTFDRMNKKFKAEGLNPIQAALKKNKEAEKALKEWEENEVTDFTKTLESAWDQPHENVKAKKVLDKAYDELPEDEKYDKDDIVSRGIGYIKLLENDDLKEKVIDKLSEGYRDSFVSNYNYLKSAVKEWKNLLDKVDSTEEEFWDLVNDTKDDLTIQDNEWLKSQKTEIEQILENQKEETELYKDAGKDMTVLKKKQKKEIEDFLDRTTEPIIDSVLNKEIKDDEPDYDVDFNFEEESNGARNKAGYSIKIEERKYRKKQNDLILLDEKERQEKEYELLRDFQDRKKELLQTALNEETDLTEKAGIWQELADLEIEINQTKNEKIAADNEAAAQKEKEIQEQKKQIAIESLSVLSGVVAGMADLYQQDLDNQLAAGKISEEAYNLQFKKVKGLQIAEATINTIAGALGAFMGITKDTGGWGIAVAAIQAAAVAATGAFQIAKIAKTEPGAANVERGMVEPPANIFAGDSNPQAVTNITGLKQTEELNKAQRVVILESDIQESLKRVQVRESETSF